MDLTIEAIEQDLMNAEARAGQPIAAVYLKRAEIRATLMNGWNVQVTPDVNLAGEVLVEGSWFKVADLPGILGNYMRSEAEAQRELKVRYLQLEDERARNADPKMPDSGMAVDVEDDETNHDFFAEAKRERKK